MKVIFVRQNPEYKEKAIKFFQKSWSEISPIIYEDCISNSIAAEQSLPQWYLLEKDEEIIGCAGLITNDFISRMDLYPWLCALFINEDYRGNHYGELLINKAKEGTKDSGFKYLNLCTDYIGFYEKYGSNISNKGIILGKKNPEFIRLNFKYFYAY
ncbi:GNAT family N-acetyltransferase [Chryseobacterium sp. CFS15]|uniref:GNAT family N-acetyltransferase n=1 Tax=Chryseobacterium sp. CFS15 TaxID=2986946 RepID=UPI00280885E5|nr:GNAT family N-acetyltransferase [Chryseobacterium sp. CFS15]MDQ8141700.1 GNAT family N-acetyltransferase [Chryseobacterium sp. CFS15]